MRSPFARAVLLVAAAACAVVARAEPARAAEPTDVASSFDKDNPFDFRFRVSYDFFQKTGAIKREVEGVTPTQERIEIFKDLVYKQQRHTLGLRAEVGLFKDLALTIGMPLVIEDTRSIGYDQRLGNGCIYPGTAQPGQQVNCVNAANSTTTNSAGAMGVDPSDPTMFIVPPGGLDYAAGAMGAMFPAGSDLVFRGPKRGGSGLALLDTFDLGLAYAILSQKRDDTKPTWLIGVDYKFSIGEVAKFDRRSPGLNAGVADGLDHLVVRTSVSHRFRYVDPFLTLSYDLPIVRRNDTLFQNWGPTAKNQYPVMKASVIFGLEGVPYEQKDKEYKIVLNLAGRITSNFDGRGYSEAWEMLATSPALGCGSSGDATIDARDAMFNPACGPGTMNVYQGQPYTGITTIENFVTLGAQAGFGLQLGKYVRFRADYNYHRDQGHFIAVDDVGKPAEGNDRVSQPNEFNPAYRPIIHSIGRRYRIDDVDVHGVSLFGQVMF